MIEKRIKNFSIKQICDSGQCFRMNVTDNGDVAVIAKGKRLIVHQEGELVQFHCGEEEYNDIWKHYFDIEGNTDYEGIMASIDKNDTYLINAAKYGSGIRILNQDLWEMIISFIISQQNNIKRIRGCISRLCEKYGEKICFTGEDGSEIFFYDFPTPEILANADIEDIKALGVGYRAPYIKRAAEDVANLQLCLADLESMSYDMAKKELLRLYGVGNKVADCICLFSLHHLEAFPRDTHINSIVDREYNGDFPFTLYDGYEGVLQQYMFYYDLGK